MYWINVYFTWILIIHRWPCYLYSTCCTTSRLVVATTQHIELFWREMIYRKHFWTCDWITRCMLFLTLRFYFFSWDQNCLTRLAVIILLQRMVCHCFRPHDTFLTELKLNWTWYCFTQLVPYIISHRIGHMILLWLPYYSLTHHLILGNSLRFYLDAFLYFFNGYWGHWLW